LRTGARSFSGREKNPSPSATTPVCQSPPLLLGRPPLTFPLPPDSGDPSPNQRWNSWNRLLNYVFPTFKVLGGGVALLRLLSTSRSFLFRSSSYNIDGNLLFLPLPPSFFHCRSLLFYASREFQVLSCRPCRWPPILLPCGRIHYRIFLRLSAPLLFFESRAQNNLSFLLYCEVLGRFLVGFAEVFFAPTLEDFISILPGVSSDRFSPSSSASHDAWSTGPRPRILGSFPTLPLPSTLPFSCAPLFSFSFDFPRTRIRVH